MLPRSTYSMIIPSIQTVNITSSITYGGNVVRAITSLQDGYTDDVS